MLTIFLIFFPLILSAQTEIGSYNDSTSNSACPYFLVEEVELQIDESRLHWNPDTTSLLHLIVSSSCEECEIVGPSYVPVKIWDESGNVLAQTVINGIPEYTRPMHYYVQCPERLYAVPESMTISLEGYCTSLKQK